MEIYLKHSVSSVSNVDNVCVPLISDKPRTEKGELNVTENVEVNVGETVQVNEGEDVSLNDGEAVQVSEGDDENTHGENTHDDVELNNQNLEENTDVEEAESDTSEDSVRGIHFDDSEEERVIDTDDGFRHDEVGEAETELNERLNNMKRQAGSNINAGGSAIGPNEGRGSRQRGEPIAPEVENMHAMEEEYDSEELLSGAENNDIEGDGKPRHRCGRVFNNKNVNSKWIAKVVVDKFRTSSNVKLSEIIEDVRKNYSVGVSEWKAWKLGHNSRRCKAPLVNPSPAAKSETTNIGTQQSQQAQQTTQTAQARGKTNQGNSNQQAQNRKGKTKQQQKGKGKSISQPQLSQQSQGRSHHTMRKTMTKSNNDTTKSTKGSTQWKRGKKKFVPPGPAIPDFARNMSVGQLVTHLSRVWEEHRARVTALASAQSGEIPTQEEAHEAHPHSTLAPKPQPAAPQGEDSLINDHNANVQNTDEVRGSTFTG
ncbi:hypothetical protein SESBI_08647 [Sesbania bispinosa]|nr:hypothetical protein SESBI_08647 [Sesbania bispinosa]